MCQEEILKDVLEPFVIVLNNPCFALVDRIKLEQTTEILIRT